MDLMSYVIDSYENKEYVETNETIRIERELKYDNYIEREKRKKEEMYEQMAKEREKRRKRERKKKDVLETREKYYKELEDNYCKPHNNIIGGN